jgi:dTDP-4-dehydrorhamnose reductase
MTERQRFLLIGGDSMLGGLLFERWQRAGHEVAATALLPTERPGFHPLDLAAVSDSWTPPHTNAAVVICAAITNQDLCRRDPVGTRHINVEQTLKVIRRLIDCGCFVTFISSNMVFDGTKPLVRPDEPVRPGTQYGRHKAEVEAALKTFGKSAAVVRLTKVVHGGLPVIRNWIKALEEGKTIAPFSDYLCAPLSLDATLETIARVAERRLPGIWHASPQDDISYADMAKIIARYKRLDEQRIAPMSAPPNTLEFLPAHTTLDASRTTAELGVAFAPFIFHPSSFIP